MSLDVNALWSRTGAALAGSAIRQMGLLAAGRDDVISFAPGYPDADVFAWDDYRAIADDILRRESPDTLQYTPTRGLGMLLDTLRPFAARRGVACTPDQMLVTTGSQQGIDLLTRVLVDPGDVVLVELPTFAGAIAAFRNGGAALHGVRQDVEGLDLDHLASTVTTLRGEGRKVKFLYVIPNFQNPTGGLMSARRRRALYDYASREGLLLVEDDPYGDLYFDETLSDGSTRPIKTHDTDASIVYLQSTSKTLAPAFRTGWVIGPAAIVARLEIAKQSTDLCSSGLDQRMVCEALTRGIFDRELPVLRQRYAQRAATMVEALRSHATEVLQWQPPRGGFFVWAEARRDVDVVGLVTRAVDTGVVYVPGGPFYVDGRTSPALRLAFSWAPLADIAEGVRRLATVMASAPVREA